MTHSIALMLMFYENEDRGFTLSESNYILMRTFDTKGSKFCNSDPL